MGLKEITRHQAMATLIRQADAGTTLLHPGSTLPQGLSPALTLTPPLVAGGWEGRGGGGRTRELPAGSCMKGEQGRLLVSSWNPTRGCAPHTSPGAGGKGSQPPQKVQSETARDLRHGIIQDTWGLWWVEWCPPPKKIHIYLEPMNVALFG